MFWPKIVSTRVGHRRSTAVVAIVAAWVTLALGCPPKPAVHTVTLLVDPATCGHDCVCATPDPFKVKRGDTVEWVNKTSSQVTITPSVSGTYTGPNTGTVGGVAGVVTVPPNATVSVSVSTSLDAPSSVALDLLVVPQPSNCQAYPGPRMDVDD